jgi:hypothetical protein
MVRSAILALSLLFAYLTCAANAAQPEQSLQRRFDDVVLPFLKEYCLGCHGAKKQEAKLNLSGFTSVAAVAKEPRVWETVLERLKSEEMPPEKAKKQPTVADRKAVLDWLQAMREQEARRTAGDPGRVPVRRLSNAEFDYTIRDLTGVDMRPAREFPVDPANEPGFDNSGESLTMSPPLMKKYLKAVRLVADHLVLKPDGLVFAPHPAVTDTDRDKYCVQRIVAFYERHQVDYADYFLAAWRYQHRADLGKPEATVGNAARDSGLSARYLATLASLLIDAPLTPGPLGEVQKQWRSLPASTPNQSELKRECERLRDLVIRLRKEYTPIPGKLHIKGISDGSQPFVLWRNAQIAAKHMDPGEKEPGLAQFCRVFPDAFVVTERAPFYDASTSAKGRLLSAGFHLMYGYYRDDGPLCELILNEAERRELDALWAELHFVTQDAARQYKDFIFFERAEPPRFMQEPAFDFARSEDKSAISPANIERARAVYVAKARKIEARPQALDAIEAYFTTIATQIRKVEDARHAAEPAQLKALLNFAARAYRRPLAAAENDEILAFYRRSRERDQLSHEEAVRDAVAYILLAPQFCYRLDPPPAGAAIQPLPDYALASRLSYFLWSSMPDEELLAHAAAGDLHKPEVLTSQTRRMLTDVRVRGLAEQFAGNWLEFGRFEETNTVDRSRFPSFTNELRQAMAEEPLRFFIHVASQDRPVLDFLNADYTFVNPVLAKHYGIPHDGANSASWIKIENASRYGRGGLLPMAIFLTKNAPGLRTSPVKRGYWVVRRLLGERIPPPPPEVPELPKDEALTGEHTLPELLARHRANKACAGCHQRFDSLGLAFEGFGPIGERRSVDLGGRVANAKATFPDGSEGEGLAGLRHYLSGRRQEEFMDNLCRKLFAYALGRSLTFSDQTTLEEMRARLKKDDYRFGSLIEAIVASPQFRNRRGRDDPRE